MPQVPLDGFIARWSASAAAERANKDVFLMELCDGAGIMRTHRAGSEGER